MDKKKRVIFACSSGGHLSEMLKLNKIFDEYEYVIVTEKTQVTQKLKENYNIDFFKYGPTKNIFKYIWNVLYNMLVCIKQVLKFKPDTIVSTGAQVGGMMCLFGKLFGSKVIYIESLAKVNSLSITGKNVYLFADKFYVQWENLTKKYEKAEYIGRLM